MTDEVIEGGFRPTAVEGAPDGCGNCAYWFSPNQQNVGHSSVPGAQVGLCRRFPPTTIVVGAQTAMNGQINAITQAAFPPMDGQGWCGEHKARP